MVFKFGDIVLDSERRELWQGANQVIIEPGVFELLEYVIRNRDRVVSKDDLIENVWKGRIVSESTLTSRITAVRQAIGDNGQDQRLIRTVPRCGVRFVGDVAETPAPAQRTLEVEAASAVLERPKPSIAVLPFTNISADPEQEYFSDGITEDIIMALSRLRWFFVIARNSSFAYKGQTLDVRQIGQELDVAYLLEGSVRKAGQRLRITCQLLDAETGNHIWSERYDCELIDVFDLQDEITQSVVSAVEPKLVAAEGQRAETRSSRDLQAWDLVTRALPHFWKFTAEENSRSVAILREAVERYPEYAPAHSMLSFALLVSSYLGWEHNDREMAERFALNAMEIDEQDPWAHVAIGFVAMTERKTEDALHHFHRALELNPNFATAVGFVGFTLTLDGQTDEGLKYLERAARMNPREPLSVFFSFAPMGAAHYLAGTYDEAIRWALQAVKLRPSYPAGHRILCASLAQTGRLEEAKAAFAELQRLQPDISVSWVRRWVPYTKEPMEKFIEGLRKAGLPD